MDFIHAKMKLSTSLLITILIDDCLNFVYYDYLIYFLMESDVFDVLMVIVTHSASFFNDRIASLILFLDSSYLLFQAMILVKTLTLLANIMSRVLMDDEDCSLL